MQHTNKRALLPRSLSLQLNPPKPPPAIIMTPPRRPEDYPDWHPGYIDAYEALYPLTINENPSEAEFNAFIQHIRNQATDPVDYDEEDWRAAYSAVRTNWEAWKALTWHALQQVDF